MVVWGWFRETDDTGCTIEYGQVNRDMVYCDWVWDTRTIIINANAVLVLKSAQHLLNGRKKGILIEERRYLSNG